MKAKLKSKPETKLIKELTKIISMFDNKKTSKSNTANNQNYLLKGEN